MSGTDRDLVVRDSDHDVAECLLTVICSRPQEMARSRCFCVTEQLSSHSPSGVTGSVAR